MAVKIGKYHVRPSRRGWTILAVCALLLSSYTADSVAAIGRMRSGVKAGTLELGGRNREEAAKLLGDRAQLLVSDPVDLIADKHRFSVAPSEVSFSPDVQATLEDAMGVGRRGNFFVRTWHRLRALFASTDVHWVSKIDRDAAQLLVRDWSAQIDTQGHEAGIEARGATLMAVGAVNGRRLDQGAAIDAMTEGLESWPRHSAELPIAVRHRRTTIEDAGAAAEVANRWVRAPILLATPDGTRHFLSRAELAGMLEAVPRRDGDEWRLQVRFSTDRVAAALGDDMKPYEKEPRSATFAVNGAVASVIAGEDGRRFDPAATARALGSVATRATQRTAQAAFSSAEPETTTEEARGLRIKELVSSFTTAHPCCQPRVHNIHKIADIVDGAIVRPGSTFSLNGFAGPRTADKGFVLAPMIFDGEYRDDVGGGVSQFATTMYNAIFFGGYRLESYKAHSYYISRYPAGREATISWQHPDLRFTNNSSSGILIKTAYSGTSITVSFYSDKEGRVVTAESGPRTNFTEPTEQREENPALAPGEEKVAQKGAQGFDIVVFRIINKGGDVTRTRFFTRYKAQPTIIEFGPGASPSPSPGAEGEPREPRRPGDEETPEPTETPEPDLRR
ncbi:MAG: VanW family protein [Actinomycetota bacterium]